MVPLPNSAAIAKMTIAITISCPTCGKDIEVIGLFNSHYADLTSENNHQLHCAIHKECHYGVKHGILRIGAVAPEEEVLLKLAFSKDDIPRHRRRLK